MTVVTISSGQMEDQLIIAQRSIKATRTVRMVVLLTLQRLFARDASVRVTMRGVVLLVNDLLSNSCQVYNCLTVYIL